MAQHLDHDLIVVGAGPAGLACSIYSSWLGLDTLILEAGTIGGRAAQISQVENYPSFPDGITGTELATRMASQASKLGVHIKANEEVVALNVTDKRIYVSTRRDAFESLSLVLATGVQRRKLKVVGEAEFLGKGVSYCAVCDAPFFREQVVAVVGHGAESVADALLLADLAKHVFFITPSRKEPDKTAVNGLESKNNVEVVQGEVTSILGEKTVKSVAIIESKTGKNVVKEVNGVFISLGRIPLTAVIRNAGVRTDDNGCIIVDRRQRTNIEGVFAAGDCTCGGMQIVTAAGEGAMAAIGVASWVRRRKKSR